MVLYRLKEDFEDGYTGGYNPFSESQREEQYREEHAALVALLGSPKVQKFTTVDCEYSFPDMETPPKDNFN